MGKKLLGGIVMKGYEINTGTMCLMQLKNGNTKVMERNKSYEVFSNIHKIVDESCRSFGSSLSGRLAGTTKLTGIRYKAPVILSEELSIILLPTGSTRGEICHWLSLYSIKEYTDEAQGSVVELINGEKIHLKISKFVLQNQISKAIRLEHWLKRHNNEQNRY